MLEKCQVVLSLKSKYKDSSKYRHKIEYRLLYPIKICNHNVFYVIILVHECLVLMIIAKGFSRTTLHFFIFFINIRKACFTWNVLKKLHDCSMPFFFYMIALHPNHSSIFLSIVSIYSLYSYAISL